MPLEPVELEQLLINLVVNARDAMPEGGRIELRGELELAAPSVVFASRSRTRAWVWTRPRAGASSSRFTTKAKDEGTRVGLAIGLGLVRATPGRGAIFAIDLPSADPRGSSADQSTLAAASFGPRQPGTATASALGMESQTAAVHPAAHHADATLASTTELEPAPSKAAIAGHPIHPMLIPFPVALLALVPLTDIVYAATEATFWASVSYYLLWAGLVTAGLAAVAGLIDFFGIERARSVRAGWVHLLLNVVVVVLAVVNLLLRVGDTVELVLPSGLILSLVVLALLLVSGWYGGELVYRHKIGVMRQR